mmetsp:Transcript_42919/g.80429  ORF Transcript_42919/g.80429 Transcript_42919/m.80429 type:complete len:85 (+) Transcript_42919:491-745(+)
MFVRQVTKNPKHGEACLQRSARAFINTASQPSSSFFLLVSTSNSPIATSVFESIIYSTCLSIATISFYKADHTQRQRGVHSPAT